MTDARALLRPIDVRILAVLAEKESLTPDAYPMSLNALCNGCNQLSSRYPVMALAEADVSDALKPLIPQKLVNEVSQAGARVVKYAHRLRLAWSLEQDKLAVLTVLALRGPQTVSEIRARSERMQSFSHAGEAETCLQFLIDKYPPLVARLHKAPGTKECRYVHLLTGDAEAAADDPDEPFLAQATHGDKAQCPHSLTAPQVTTAALAPQPDRIALLEQQVATLRQELDHLADRFAQSFQQNHKE